ncbi:armadillo repeat-containing protein 10 isoform X2 [Folsomia candida]|uniref:Armadillo repeat-containing protein 10 n=2 Tax=Folsomia candida TaxID=158441 RepID=A0A226E473_FOLCA|nr:armadillo repeat-containing protein 10 isoform X2 [Folsomia candida]XP_035708888.1 armadillo repeat-containing protein 10 isoform X2 [Folsomia candida]OXA52525.1 Armadillo repeat-containing protein 10 [Folsomia candida]
MASSGYAGSSTTDRTVNKVALCSAIFAGFAYVGYSVVRTAFHRRRKEGDLSYPEGEARLYFRRLSQTTQTDALLGNLDVSNSGKIVLRPLSVQERIRELNFRARHFADTMLALQGNGGAGRHSSRSLQCSPWSSPRILSPVDIRHFIASRSSDNLSLVPAEGSPVRRRWSRKSIARKSPEVGFSAEESTREADKAIQDISEELKEKLESLSLKGRTMDAYEAKTLVALLYTSDEGVLERALISAANLATMAHNQNNLREAGCLQRLQNLLSHPKSEIRLAAIRALGNMALNEMNQREMKPIIPALMSYIGDISKQGEEIVEAVLTTLANIAVLPDWHTEFCPALHTLYSLLDQLSLPIRLQSLKLLVNLSTNEEMVPSLLAAQAPKRLLYLLDNNEEQEVLLRVLTLLANLTSTAATHDLSPTQDLPPEEKAASPDTMYAAIFGVNVLEKIIDKSKTLMNCHSDEDIRIQSRRMFTALKKQSRS